MCCLCCWIKFCSTQYNTPRTFCLAGYSVVFCDRCLRFTTHPLTTKTALNPLDATLRNWTLPFLILIRKLVLCWGQHHLLLSAYLGSLWCYLWPLSTHSFQHTCFIITSTGLISERYLAVVSRLA
jgi:hypothetical protein